MLTLAVLGCSSKEEEPYYIPEEILIAAGLPVVHIHTKTGVAIRTKKHWIAAEVKITNASEESQNFNFTDIKIRGRGNSTWSRPKKPYTFKLEHEQSILGMPEHERWVLIANYCDNSFMKNESAFFLSRQLGLPYTVRGRFVNLVVNQSYEGLYWLGEMICTGKERISIDDKTDFLLEADLRQDDEYTFTSQIKQFPFNIKNDSEMNSKRLSKIKNTINDFEQQLYAEDGTVKENKSTWQKYVDYDSFAKFWLVNAIMQNTDCFSPRSLYVVWQNDLHIMQAFPVWDFDNSARQGAKTSNVTFRKNNFYYDALFTDSSFVQAVGTAAKDLDPSAFCDFYDKTLLYIQNSVNLDQERWGPHPDWWDGSVEWSSVQEAQDFLKEFVSGSMDSYKARYAR